MTALSVRDLKVHFPAGKGKVVHAVDGVSFDIPEGTAFGLVGESGSGKTTAALACARLVEATAGEVRLGETDITTLAGDAMRRARRDIQVVFQDPYASLNPRERVGAIVRRPLDLMKVGTPTEREARVDELFATVGLRPDQKALFPHQFSGGQRQRIGIARALATHPKLIVCDEPVSALDVAIQAQILNLLARLKAEMGLSYLFISHDLAVVQHLCDRIAVMYLGRIIEEGPVREVIGNPKHPYTRGLLAALPRLDDLDSPLTPVPGDIPSPLERPAGCVFNTRCREIVGDVCQSRLPPDIWTDPTHRVACHLHDGKGGEA